MSKIQIITGSTRPGRINPQVAQWIQEVAAKRSDIDVELVDIADYNLPLFDEPMSPMMGQPTKEHTKKWAAKIAEADGFIFVTPEYNHGMPGALKNAIDFLYQEWTNKAAGIVSYGAHDGLHASDDVRRVLNQLQVAVVSSVVTFNLMNDFEGYTTHTPGEAHEVAANAMLDQLVAWTKAMETVRG